MRHRRHKERRRHPRIPLVMQVSFTANGKVHRNYTTNFSKSGMFLATETPPKVGDQIHLSFNIPGLIHPLRLLGEVKWSRSKPVGNVPPGAGIEFVQLTETCKHLISEFVDRLAPVSELREKVNTSMNWEQVRNLYCQRGA